ncbi:MAG TPA: type II secretion system minor pseudopilin GspK [Geomonas sp.]
MRGERGFALVITLIVTALLVALLVEFVSEVYVDTSHSHNFVASQQASILAESGLAGGIKLLQVSSLMRQGQSYSSLSEPWAKPQSYDAGVGSVTITIEEESGKMNLNQATSPNGTDNQNQTSAMALRLFKNLKLSADLFDALMDWVDENDAPRSGGAETSYYSTLKTPYKAKNARLETVEELAMLKGFTPEILTKLRPCVSVYGSLNNAEFVTPINVNTAPKEVLAVLDEKMTESLVESIIDSRMKSPIKSQRDLLLISGMDTILPNIVDKITFSGSVYRIHAEGRVGESVSVAEAVVRMASGQSPPLILYWREY